jgi:Na+/H+-dicarboxylate symporter
MRRHNAVARAIGNVIGNAVASVVIAKSCGEF